MSTRRKVFEMMVTIMFVVFTGLMFISTAFSEDVALDPQALVGRWEGSARELDSIWLSPFAIEIFAVDVKGNRAMYRGMCRDCRNNQQWYSDRLQLTIEKGKIILQTPQRGDWSGITFEFKGGDRINGFARRDTMEGSWRSDYSLKKLPEVKRIFEPRELIGEWIWVSGDRWWKLTVSEVDAQNKTFKGKYMIGTSKREYDISNAKIITDGGDLRLEFKTLNDTLRYQLAFYPSFGEYPPVLWGKLERMDGNILYPMFRKKD